MKKLKVRLSKDEDKIYKSFLKQERLIVKHVQRMRQLSYTEEEIIDITEKMKRQAYRKVAEGTPLEKMKKVKEKLQEEKKDYLQFI